MSKIDLVALGANQIKNVSTNQLQPLSDLWKNDTCVVIFLRRWGCMFCRLWSKELQEISPILQKHNVKLYGIGPEELGVEEFVEGKYFDGDLFIDTKKTLYSSLGFKRFSYLSVMAALLWKESRDAMSKGRKLKLGGNTKGDGLQNGGALIIEKGGKVLTHFVQNGPAEHLSNYAILKALNLADIEGFKEAQPDITVSEGECERKP